MQTKWLICIIVSGIFILLVGAFLIGSMIDTNASFPYAILFPVGALGILLAVMGIIAFIASIIVLGDKL